MLCWCAVGTPLPLISLATEEPDKMLSFSVNDSGKLGDGLFKRTEKSRLTGATSWLAILGAAFFWVWLDRGMFGSALLASATQEAAEVVTISLMVANILTFVAVYVTTVKNDSWTPWPFKAMTAAAGIGVLGGLLCLIFSGGGNLVPLCIGGIFLGIGMGFFNVIWGVVAISQGVKKTLVHISGAWGFSLFLNLAISAAPSQAAGLIVTILPLLSLFCYLALRRFQSKERYAIRFKYTSDDTRVNGRQIFGIDIQFLVIILVFCGVFGFVSWFGAASASPLLGHDGDYLVFARCAVALAFFSVCYFFSMKQVDLLLKIALSLVAAGVVVLTIGVFVPTMNEPGRVFVAMGYSGFDILVWTLISYYARTSSQRAVRVVAVVMIAEQVGILLGIASGMVVDHIDAGQFEASIFLAAMNYILLLSCFALLKRYDSRPILLDEAPAESALSGGSRVAVDFFAKNFQLTSREKQVAYLLAEGRNVPYISKKLFVAENTVKSHVRHIYEKSDVHNRQELLDELEVIRRS
jgi:DNA-binding NarL/FixJ family response regulator